MTSTTDDPNLDLEDYLIQEIDGSYKNHGYRLIDTFVALLTEPDIGLGPDTRHRFEGLIDGLYLMIDYDYEPGYLVSILHTHRARQAHRAR